jgi:hypothetical protein
VVAASPKLLRADQADRSARWEVYVKASTIFLMATVMTGCMTAPDVSWGPLAVARVDFGMGARNQGMLVITERCVFIERDGERELLLWPADRTSWSTEADEIHFRRSNGEVIKRRDGQPVVLGGGSFETTVDGPNGEKVPREVDWIAEPDPSCAEPRWLVSDVEP